MSWHHRICQMKVTKSKYRVPLELDFLPYLSVNSKLYLDAEESQIGGHDISNQASSGI